MTGKASNRQRGQESKPIEHRSVVSNFIFKEVGIPKHDEPKILVALFRRSEKVTTYQNKFAPISGSIDQSDASPTAAAARELREETSLATPADLKLFLRGHSFSISDSNIGRRWTVYPFSWKFVKPVSEQKISLDWEHSSWEWIDPIQIFSGSMDSECVPRLSESLRRVYVGPNGLGSGAPRVNFNSRASQILRSALHDLQTDHTNGARILATKAGTALSKIAADCGVLPDKPTASDLGAWFRILRMASWLLITNGRPSMNAATTTWLLRLLDLIQSNISSSSPPPLSQIHTAIQSALTSRSSTSDLIASSFVSYLTTIARAKTRSSQDTPLTLNLLTLSSSSTLLHSLAHFLTNPPKDLQIHLNLSILESRPLFEGVTLATSLPTNSPNLHITVAPDSAVALLARSADLVLLGADRISAAGDVSNKTGSYAAVVVAQAVAGNAGREVKVAVVSESEKVAKPSDEREGAANGEHVDERKETENEEDNGPEDVIGSWRRVDIGGQMEVIEEGIVRLDVGTDRGPKEIQVKNVYFEWVPAKYIDAYITEKGAMSTQEIREAATRIAELENRMFEDLAEIERGGGE